jgi:autotransporter-associated beta strand protein
MFMKQSASPPGFIRNLQTLCVKANQPMKLPMKKFIHHSRISSVLAVLVSILGSSTIAFGQLQWSSYDTSGNLVAANVATGGDAASATTVSFTVPASTRMFFITRSFTPIVLSQQNAAAVVTFKFSASGGITGVAQKTVEWGLYNSMGTASLADDMGMFGGWTGSTVEGLLHASGSANLFSGTSTGQGVSSTGAPTDGTTYTNQIRLFFKTAPIGVALGSSSSTLAAAGIAMNGAGITSRLYTNPGNWTNTVDEFALMFNNTTANPVTVTLSGIGLGTALTWDASGANPVTPTDGGGNWSTTNANWSSGVGGAIGASDSVWFPGYNAVIGANNGAAGTLTNTDAGGVTVSNLTFNAAGSGSYNISGTPLILAGTPTITVASGVSATNNAPLGGTGFTKAGNGTFVLLPSVAATNVGVTTVNAGTLFLGSAAVINLNDDLVVNAGGLVNVAGANAMNTSKTLTLNGGALTNVSPTQTTMTFGRIIFDNHGALGSAGNAGTGPQIVITNIDARSGILAYDKFSSAQTTNCTVKSTAGIYTNQCGANNSGVQGYIITALGGTIVMDYPLLRPNGGTAGRGQFMNSGALTLGGGTLLIQGNSGRSETVLGAIVQPGGSSVVMNNSGTPNMTLVQGAITRNIGGTVNYSKSATGSGSANFSTTTINFNGNLGGAITIGGNDWVIGSASGSATSISAYSAYTTTTDPSAWVVANNVSLGAVTVGTFTANTTINSLKYTATPVSDITLGGNTLTLGSGGLLVTGSAAPTISGGTLQGGSGTDLIVQQYSTSDLNISATLADNTTATSLTKSGPGKLIITGTDNMTGANYLNGGTVEVSDLAKLASGPLVMNNGALRYTGSDASSTRAITVNGVGAIIDVAGGTTLTQTGAIVSGGGVNSPINGVNMGDWSGLTKIGSGTLVLAANNVYNGPTVVSNGVLSVNGTNSLTGTSGLTNYSGGGSFTVYGGTLGGMGMISGPVDIKNGGTISPGNSIGTLTLASGLTLESGSTSLFEVTNNAAGDLLVVQGNLTIQPNCTIAISVLGASALEPSTNTLVTYTGTKSGSFNPTVVVTGGSLDSSLSIDESTPGQIKLVAVPQVALTCQPQDVITSTNDPVTFNVCANGSAPIGYQWYYTPNVSTPAAPIDGATSSSYFIAHADGTNNGYYSVVVTNNYNSVTSRVASLTVGNVCSQLSGPFDQTVIQSNNATFTTMVLIGNPPPTLQWQVNNVNVDGATNTSLTLTNVQYAVLNNAAVCVIASNAACMVTNCATLTVIIPPVITPQLTNITVNVGDTANFVSGATGIPTPGLQWYKNGVGISGQTNGTLTINNAQGSDIATYTLVATNAAGSATNSAKLTVSSLALVQATLAPANGATGVCYDTPLYITFNGPVSIVNSGRILIYNSTNPVTPVDTIDMSSNTVVVSPTILLTNNIQPHSLFSGDSQVINYFPVIISGNTAAIYPHSGVMTSNQTYYVTLDNGIVKDGSGAYFAGISDTNAWRFTTRMGGPVNPTNLVVAADGSGDFLTVQGAVDSILPGNTSYTVVNIRDGNYVEIVDISGKNNITFRGQSRAGTVVGYANNNNLTGTTAGRMAFKVNASDIKIENLTLTNGTPQGGSQAETLLVYNNGLRCVVNNCDIKSRQDTILINANTSQAYFHYCEIYGNFDYIWGVGVGYFDHCSFHTITNSLSSSYNLTAARTLTAGAFSTNTPWVNPNGTTYSAYGFSFVNCTIEADPGVTNITLAGSNGTAGGLDSWALCRFDINAYVGPVALSNTYVFWQYSNTDLAGNPISFPGLQTIGVTNNDPRLLAATNAPVWFSGWVPQSVPNIVSQPVNVSVSFGQSTSFSASATGIPDPSYQWYQNGQPISGATGTNLNITSAVRTNGGSYTVVVSNGSGSVTSSVATLTYINTAPVANASTYVRPAGSPLNILIPGNLSTNWSDVDADPLALTGGISSTNGASVGYDSTYVHYTNANDVADEIDYTIGDGFGGTAAGAISVVIGPPPTNSVAGVVVNGDGSVTLSFVGVPDYTYQVEATADLTPPAVWTTVSTNTADISGLWQFTDTQATNYTQRYYRSVYRP